MLNDQEIQQIHQASMRLLENVGVEFPHPEALEVFQRHGVRVDGCRVYWTEGQLLSALETVPRQFTIQARNPERSVTVGGGRPVFAPCYGAPFLVDAAPGGDGVRWVGKRAPTMDDYITLVKLADALPNQDMSGHLLVEPDTSPARMLQAHMLHSDKPFIGSAAGKKGAQHTLQMASILFDDDLSTGDPDGKYVTISLINSLSPLGYSTEMLEALVTFARARQPLVIAALMMAGSTGPITLAGVLAAQTAELLAGIALTQLISPGTPAV
ncbi:MAG: trimethylamine--corrinoid methyltransferase, partial [Chloroflexi bacterium]